MSNTNHKRPEYQKEVEQLGLYKDATNFLFENLASIKSHVSAEIPPPSRLRNLDSVFALGGLVYGEIHPLILKAMEKKERLGHIKIGRDDMWCQKTRRIRITSAPNTQEGVVVLGHELGHDVSCKDYFKGLQSMREIPARAVEIETAEHIRRFGMDTTSCEKNMIVSLTNLIEKIKSETDVITGSTSKATPARWNDIYRADILPYYFGAIFNVLRSEKHSDLVSIEDLLKMKNRDVLTLTKQMTESKKCVTGALDSFLERSL